MLLGLRVAGYELRVIGTLGFIEFIGFVELFRFNLSNGSIQHFIIQHNIF